jgi:isoleucyl-tRNA synthetase
VTLVAADPALAALVAPHLDLLRDELNVKQVAWAEDRATYVRHLVRPVFPKLGPRFGRRMPLVKAALAAADGDRLAAQLEADGRLTIEVGDELVELAPEEVEIVLEEREGTATQGDRELLVALDARLTPELVAEGWAREIVSRLQAARKDLGLEYTDRISVRYRAEAGLADAIARHAGWIAGETLADRLIAADDADLAVAPVDGRDFAFAIARL